MRRVEIDGREWNPGLNAPLQLQQLNLKISGGREVRLLFLQAPKLDDFSRLGPRLLSFRHGRIVLDAGFSGYRGNPPFLQNPRVGHRHQRADRAANRGTADGAC